VAESAPQRPVKGRGPIFIIGAMGTGTTLLRLVLDSHPRIAIPQETGFMRAERAHRFIPFKWSGRRWYRRMGWTEKEFDALLGDFYDTVFRRYAEQHGKVRWGEKTPLHTWHIDDMIRLFPDAVFVGIVRHPGGSVASNMNRWKHPLGKAAFHYARYVTELARQASRRRRRFVVVRYEELLLQPEAVMRELLEWLGEPWSDHVLDHHSVQGRRGGRTNVEGRNRVDDPIDVSRISKWTGTIATKHDRKELDRLAGSVGRFFGYDIDDPATLEPLRDDGKLLIRGADLHARKADFPELDLKTQPPVPLVDRLYHPGEVALTPALPPKTSWVPEALRHPLRPLLVRLPRFIRRRLSASARMRLPSRERGSGAAADWSP
jgi:hypothetical protein